ncbi:MAG: PAS domain S-box protein [Anaerolineae bacterium]|jgi:PAS domain S-box-containing protein|nr:PAS domain S-box protein [Anaerolineae bacterium]MBT7071190.1 PAS domain S-box protein [Anaerolineae bacterium]MBT7324452.1 PAS domain S-box protein [Anaerolineae bacterium]
MNWQEIVVIVVLLLSSLSGLVLTFYTWRRRSLPGLWAFGVIAIGLAWWSFWYAAEVALPGLPSKVWMARLEYIGIVWVPFGWVTFALAYTERGKWLTRKWILLLGLIPVITIIAAFTNDFHHLFYTSVALNENGPLSVLDASYGLLWYLNFGYAYILLLVGTVLLFIRIFSIPKAYWFQQVLLIISPLLPWVANLLYVLRISPMPQLDLSPLAFTVSALILGMDIFRFRLFDVSPLARSTVIDNMDIVMMVVDNQDRVVDVNPAACALLGYKTEELLGQTVREIFRGFPELFERFSNVAEINEEIDISQDGNQLYFRVQINPIYDNSQRVSGRLLLLTDITRSKITEQALMLAQVRTEFLAKVSHELRTPINAVLGMAELLTHGVYGPVNDRQEKALNQIVERTVHLNHLIKDLLEYTHRETGNFALQNKEFSPVKLLESVQEIFGVLARDKGLSLKTEVLPGIFPTMLGDSTRLLQILLNLTENAIKFTEVGEVVVRFQKVDSEHWALEVSDTGIGIPDELQKHIFEAFQQANYSITRDKEGVGLGLSIVKQLVDGMGGTIQIKQVDQGGTTFLIVLPLLKSDAKGNDYLIDTNLMF